jgi:sugar O-acyltransferase (sialic acid O-acetyltransferase NeuD family)
VRTLIYGSRPDGHAKVVAELASADEELELVGLVDDFEQNSERTVRGLTVLGTGEQLAELRSDHADAVLLGFGENEGRAELAQRLTAAGFALPVLVAESAVVCPSAQLSEGAQVLALTYVGPDARVGRGALVNTGAIIEHDVVLEEGAVVGPGATICGRVTIGSEGLVGAGATILPDVRVGVRAVVGAGALVRGDVPDRVRVAGVPAQPLA